MNARTRSASIGDEIAQGAARSLAAQRALHDVRIGTTGDGALLNAMYRSHRAWRTSEAWLRSVLREVEKAASR